VACSLATRYINALEAYLKHAHGISFIYSLRWMWWGINRSWDLTGCLGNWWERTEACAGSGSNSV